MRNIVDMSDYRPHVTLCVGDTVHVYPVQCLVDVALDKLPLDTLGPEIWRRILAEWLNLIGDNPK